MVAKIVDDTAGLVSIGQLAKAAGVSSRTIRYYEELGILPEPRRSPGGTRKYPREYRGYIDTALALKDLGFRLEEIKPLARLALGRSVSSRPAGQGGAGWSRTGSRRWPARSTCCGGCATRSAGRCGRRRSLACSARPTWPWIPPLLSDGAAYARP